MPVPIRLDQRPQTLVEQLKWLAENRADDLALAITSDIYNIPSEHTYRELFEAAQGFADALQSAGVQRGDVVVLVIGHSAALVFAFWGVMLLGAVPSIFPFLSDKLDPQRYYESIRQMIVHSGAEFVLTSMDMADELQTALTGVNTRVISNLDIRPANTGEHTGSPLQTTQPNPDNTAFLQHSSGEPDEIHPDDVALLQHSSGSTGLQKGVMLSHRAVLNQIAAYSEAIRLSPDDVVVSWLPLYHDMGLIAGFILPIMQGIPLLLMSPFQWVRDPKMLLHAIHEARGTLCWLPNFAYNFLALTVSDEAIAGIDLSCWRAAINCSEPVMADSHAKFLARFSPYGFRAEALTTCYAMAENTFAVTQAGIDAPLTLDTVDRRALSEDRRALPTPADAKGVTLVSCGRPLPNCEVKIVDDQRQLLPERYVGEIALRSNSMLSGYYHQPELSAATLVDGWYFTGDIGYMADGELYITGRKKDLIIVGGKNIYPQDIENLLNDVPGVHPGRVVAFGVLNERLGTEDVAIIAEIDDMNEQGPIMREVRARVAQATEVTARYVHLVPRGWLIKTSSGKVARTANREKFLDETAPKS